MGILESMAGALAEALKKGVGRKNLVAIVAMALLASVPDLALEVGGMIVGVAVAAIVTQWRLDTLEVRRTGRDQPDNGGGAGGLVDEVAAVPESGDRIGGGVPVEL